MIARKHVETPQTLVALRDTDGDGWRQEYWPCEPDEVERILSEEGRDQANYLILGTWHLRDGGRYRTGASDRYPLRRADRYGWQEVNGRWYAMGDPLPLLPGMPQPATVALGVKYVLSVGIHLGLSVDDQVLALGLDDLDDDLQMWVWFTRILAEGGSPHAELCDRRETRFIVQDWPGFDGVCRLIVDSVGPKKIDVLVSRLDLVNEFRRLLSDIADHPCFPTEWLEAGQAQDVDDYATIEAIERAAEQEWKDGVRAGRFIDNEYGWMDLVARRFAELAIRPERAAFVERYRAMLCTLDVPEEWA